MRTASLFLHLLVLALLGQAAAAHAAMPCADGHPAEESQPASGLMADSHSAHDMHTMHRAASAPDASGPDHDPAQHPDMPCCDSDDDSACSYGNCLTSSSVLPLPGMALSTRSQPHTPATGLSWLPPYGAPPGTLFRPPIS